MNNYEKRLFVNYFDKMLDDLKFNYYAFDGVFDFFLNEFKVDRDLFDYDEDNDLILETHKQIETFKKKLKKVLINLKDKIPVKETLYEKKLNMIKDIYCLDKEEIAIFEFCLIQELNNTFKEFFNCFDGDNLQTFTRSYLGIRFGRADRLTDNLYYKNLISRHHGNVEICPDVLKVFDNPRCNSTSKIISILLGDAEKSTLTKLDFKHIEKQQKKVIKILKSAVKKRQKGVNILLHGSVGVGKTEFAKLVANMASIPIYAVKTEKEDYKQANREDRLVDLYSKQHILSRAKNSCILFDEAEDVMNRGFSCFGSASKGYLNKILENASVPVIWTTNNIYDVDPAFLRRMTYAVEFEKLSEENRLDIWKNVLKKNNLKVTKSKLEELNKSYDIPPSLIANAVQSTKMIDGDEDDFEDFIENVARVVTKKKNIKTKKEFEVKNYDINLINTDTDMDDLTQKIKKSGKLNFSLCLYGEPGSGKSLYARYLANVLGIEVVFKRASDLISKWVGETEQNIASAFAEAKAKKAMLIFDEADSFLQNRNNAQRSFEVTQVNEMLTWMESHEYPFVCTTNLFDSLDEASLRRFTFKVRYGFLTTEQVNHAIEHFFGNVNKNGEPVVINGLTAGDFATVKKKTDFLGIKDFDEIVKMLKSEVKVKKSKELQNTIGF